MTVQQSAKVDREVKAADDGSLEELIPRGNKPHWVRGGLITVVGLLATLLVMARTGQAPWGVFAGFLGVAVASWGVMDLLGTFDDDKKRVVASITSRALTMSKLQLFAALVAFLLAMAGASASIGPQWMWGAVVTALFILLAATAFRFGVVLGPYATDETGAVRPLHKRHGFWVIVVGALLYFPLLGSYGLWDPWETHYGEVAREILSRDDWISLWWVQDGWFWSKPILNFWIQALSMAGLGVDFRPDHVLAVGDGTFAHPEWAMRLPNVLMTIGAMYILYRGALHAIGRRAAMLGAIVLATMPQWYFLAHQTMADMPFVAPMTATMGFILLGLHTDPNRLAGLYEVRVLNRSLRFSAWHLVFGSILMMAIPQIVYLLSRNIDLVSQSHSFRLHWDQYKSGSPGNCGTPGNEACVAQVPFGVSRLGKGEISAFAHVIKCFEPFLQALTWSAAVVALLWLNRGERRLRRLFYIAGWLCAAIATLAKGPAGFALPMICAFAYICVNLHWREITRFEVVSGLLVIVAVALPWYVAMYMRHGPAFTDRLIFHDMFDRAFSHVHDTNEGDDTTIRYYIWQLGYACFPWTALAPLGLLAWLRTRDTGNKGIGDISVFFAMWFLFAFALFSFMGTKFHHYIFPALPAIAMLIGIVLDEMLVEPPKLPPPAKGKAPARPRDKNALMLGAGAVAGAIGLLLVGRDLVIKPDHSDQVGAIRLLHLFTYNYKRPWPESLGFASSLAVLTIVSAVAIAALSLRRIRPHVVKAVVVIAIGCAVWGLDVYMIETTPHWGQRDLVEMYYRTRKGPEEELVAYQMNWKGENFYTGNRAPVFVATGGPFATWMKKKREQGAHVMFFVTEHSRINGLRTEVGAKSYRELVSKQMNNKFVLVRAEL